jgi:dTDP-4-amino-4,6-dideoxygalactose transaminase
LLKKFEAIVRNAGFVGGAEVEGFEAEFGEFCGAEYCAGVGSGTDALRFAIMALGVRPGDEVITVPHTFIATGAAIVQAGGTVRFADVDPKTHTMAADALQAAIGSRTVGVVPVHMYGCPADMDAIREVAEHHGLWIVEDAAQAHGARYRGRLVGTLGDVACFSFYPGKNLGACGEAGAVVSANPAIVERIKMIRDHGQERKHNHQLVGYNGRLDALQAAALRVKLPYLMEWTERRRRAAGWYAELLTDVPGVELPQEPEYAESVFHLLAIQAQDRDGLRQALSSDGIGVGMHYPTPLHLQEAFSELGYGRGTFPVSERVAEHTLSLPMFPELTREEVERVSAAIRRYAVAPSPAAAS